MGRGGRREIGVAHKDQLEQSTARSRRNKGVSQCIQKGRSSSTRGRLMHSRPSFGAKSRPPRGDEYFRASRSDYVLAPFSSGSRLRDGDGGRTRARGAAGATAGSDGRRRGGCAGGDPKDGRAAARDTARDLDRRVSFAASCWNTQPALSHQLREEFCEKRCRPSITRSPGSHMSFAVWRARPRSHTRLRSLMSPSSRRPPTP